MESSMTIDQLVEYYGNSRKAASAIGVSKQAISQWRGKGIPPMRQHYIQNLTNGDLKAVKKTP